MSLSVMIQVIKVTGSVYNAFWTCKKLHAPSRREVFTKDAYIFMTQNVLQKPLE